MTPSDDRLLRLLNLKEHYRSDRDDVVRDFYVPALGAARQYDRAVGYFTSTSLALFSRGLNRMVDRNGRIRLIASPNLLEEDAEDIKKGYAVRAVMERAALRELDEIDSQLVQQGLGYLGSLIANGVMDLKLAFFHYDGRVALYHEKIGAIRDDRGDVVCFTGSANETLGGLVGNFESIEVYKSWDPLDEARALRIVRDFDLMWRNETPNLEVQEFPAVADRVVKMSKTRSVKPLSDSQDPLFEIDQRLSDLRRSRLRLPESLVVRDYQKEAVGEWFKASFSGILKMATGTGKTKTALVAATKLSDALRAREMSMVLIIVAPYQHLVDQWVDEVADFGVKALPCYGAVTDWVTTASTMVDSLHLRKLDQMTFVVTNKTFSLNPFQDLIGRINSPTLIIGDEVHNLGSRKYLGKLPTAVRYRLGLSATPERWFDDTGTAGIKAYFGDVVYEMGLAEAIERGALCHYYYYPRLVELTPDEMVLYLELTRSIGAMIASGADLSDDEGPLGQLLRRRSQVLGHASGKLPLLQHDLDARRASWYQLIYCAEGQKPVEDGLSEDPRQLEQVMQLVGGRMHLSAHQYVSETPRADRRRLLQRFGSGQDLRLLVSMRCLDEGVDIPDARVAYLLASSSNPRQFIQRRGRILRPADGKTHAEIVDYLAVPSQMESDVFEIERKLVKRELSRATEFANLADNFGAASEALREIKMRYQLMDL